jgi:hypothetical protein
LNSFFSLILIAYIAIACNSVPGNVQPKHRVISIENCNDAAQLDINVLDTLVIIKKNEIPGSGYLWMPPKNADGLQYLGKTSGKSYTDVDYSGRTVAFRFVVIKKGNLQIRLENKRAGEGQVPKDSCRVLLNAK